jgi:Beta-eliminating lyase
MADELGFEDAVFMPSGVMAQSIALLVHHHNSSRNDTTTTRSDAARVNPARRDVARHGASGGGCFACHESSHLLLHERDAYRELLGMEVLVLPSPPPSSETASSSCSCSCGSTDDGSTATIDPATTADVGSLPLDFDTVRRELDRHYFEQRQQQQHDDDNNNSNDDSARDQHHRHQRQAQPRLSTLVLEVPHRELGGKLTSLHDMRKMKEYCRRRNVRFHCDGARIFEASASASSAAAASSRLSQTDALRQLAEPFDSMYVSMYKGLGGMAGAMLLGSSDFCTEARVWLRRFGGNLYTLLPYAISGYVGLRKHWLLLLDDDDYGNDKTATTTSAHPTNDGVAASLLPPDEAPLSFVDKKRKMVDIVAALSLHDDIGKVVTFDPNVPEINMVHGYLRHGVATSQQALGAVEVRTGIRVLDRVRPVINSPATPRKQRAGDLGYRSFFEWTIGEANGRIPTDKVVEGWAELAKELARLPNPVPVDDEPTTDE